MRVEPPVTPVVFIHGLWMHASAWNDWLDLFAEHGYAPIAPGWPGESATPAATRAKPGQLHRLGLAEITDHYEGIIAELPSAPIVVGHCFGGLVAQQLLARGFARAAVAIAPAQFKGVLRLQSDQLRTAATILARPTWWGGTWLPSAERFHHLVTNATDAAAAQRIYRDFAIPAPVRPLMQVGLANTSLSTAASVDVRADRGPLLMISAETDRTAPAPVVRAAYRRQARANAGITEYRDRVGRDHALHIDANWNDVAELALDFLGRHDLTLTA